MNWKIINWLRIFVNIVSIMNVGRKLKFFQKILLEAPKAKALITGLDKSLVEN